MMKKRGIIPISILVLLVLIFLSACGKEEEPATEEGLFSELEEIAIETVLEKSEIKDMIMISAEDIVVDRIYYGSFSREDANEIFIVCKILNTIHAVTCDRRAGVLLDKESLQVTAFKDFAGDETEVRCLQTANGQSRVLHIHDVIYQGSRTPSIELYALQGSEWAEIPIDDIMELLPVNEKYQYGDFGYYMMDERLVITWESHPKWQPEQVLTPAELIAVLDWNPKDEKFVLDTNMEQPAAQQEPAEEETWLSKLEQLAVETVIENSEMNGSLVKEGYIEIVIDKIYCGSFSKETVNEIFVECRLSGIPVPGEYDTRAGFLLDADTFELTAYKEFAGNHVTLERLQTAKGQSRILFMCYEDGMEQMQSVELWGVCNGEWVELPTGIEAFIPEENKEFVTGVNGTEAKIDDNFCYLAGDRLVITYEEDGWTMFLNEISVPSELIAVLKWEPYVEKFVLDTNTEQPAAQQEPAEEETWLSELNKRVIETLTEDSYFASLIAWGQIEPVIDKIHYGSFSDEALRHQENVNEIFLDCRLKGMPHAGGLDTRAGILLDADTLELIAYKGFDGDGVMLHCLQTASGQSRILSLCISEGTGNHGQWVELWGVSGGKWEELPTGIEEFIPEEKKGDIAVGMNGPERRIEDSFCYLSGGSRLVVTYEQDSNEKPVPSELVAILEWNPFREQFVLDNHIEQPAIQQD